MFYIFGAVNILSIPIGELLPPSHHLMLKPVVYSLYPESNQRTLEEMDWLFSASKPWAWEAEKTFRILKEQNSDVIRSGSVVSTKTHGQSKDEKAVAHLDSV